ncbi:MAG: hypothetical protein PWQ82_842 [Thermosediminibacterales bacterium]|nr:hypothetical protein [Thermosediminibacterales bacterium]MDK2835929.1 hypothetical protein [Thermosediminibacterales bacterium]
MDYKQEALRIHKENKGKLKVVSKVPVRNKDDLSIAYTPGVAEPCKKIAENIDLVYEYTFKSNAVAVVTDGSAVLGLGNIGAEAALPVMEGKCVLFKEFGGVDALPICIKTQDADEIFKITANIAPAFGGINLEDISGPKCFQIERRLKETLDIPVFHDDQHGTAIVVLGGLINALKIVGKSFEEIEIVVNGAGAAGISITRLLNSMGAKNIVLCDSKGAIYPGRPIGMNSEKELIAKETNKNNEKGRLEDVIKGKDVFIGVSVAGVVSQEMIKSMNSDPIVFAMANPVPEIFPEEAKKAGVKVMGTGRSDYPNQVNNVLAFPGIFRGALDVRATDINEEMKIAAAKALAELISEDELNEEYIIPKPFDKRVGPRVAAAVAEAAVKSGVARIKLSYEEELEKASQIMNS